MKVILCLLALLFLDVSALAASRKAHDDLSLKLAQERKQQVKNVSYLLHFELMKGKKEFNGKTTILAELNSINRDLTIDSLLKKIHSVTVNGKELKKFPSRRGSLDIPKNYLAKEMKIEIEYTGEYSKESAGFKHVVDPEDGSEYTYTDFEPYYAHWLFPCFDQPDLKATYEVSVKSPKDWTVVQNELVAQVTEDGETKWTKFRQTPPLSTYLFFLGAGPYTEWKDDYMGLPLNIWARKSLAKYVDAEKIFETTKKGLKFFNEYFGHPYPFSKYGQIFVPEFAWGGMENPGAVTLNERNLFRGPVPKARIEKRDDLFLHEMAHMWFGDLVTMEWWNDLWLNESFATYLASIAMERAINSPSTWIQFQSTKSWGYWQDQLVTTHPIETPVPDVRTAKGNFDGITYAKGASSLKQLHFFVGEEGFREGLRAYFKKFAFKNTLRKDFIESIATASKMDLTPWTEKWLKTAGPNRVHVTFGCQDGKIKELTVKQSPSVSKALSPHRTRIALYAMRNDKLKLESTLDVRYEKEENPISEAIGKECPDFVFPNHDDLDYALFSLDPVSLEKGKLALLTLPDTLGRASLWTMMGQMLRDAQVSPQKYFEYALAGLNKETDDMVLGALIGRNSPVRSNYQLYLTKEQRTELAPRFEDIIWKRVEESSSGSSIQMTFFDFLVTIAQTEVTQAKFLDALKNEKVPKGLVIDQERRWALIQNLASNGHAEGIAMIEQELKKDNSTMGNRLALAARASFPDKKLKAEMWKKFFNDKDLTYSDFREAAAKIHGANNPELSRPFINDFFKRLGTVNWEANDSLVDIYFEELFPIKLCNEEVKRQSDSHLKKAKNLTSVAKRGWLEAHDELSRCMRVRAEGTKKLN